LIELLAEAGDLGLDFGITAHCAEQPNVVAPGRIQTRPSKGAFRRLDAKPRKREPMAHSSTTNE
jgi:hypothetical protein